MALAGWQWDVPVLRSIIPGLTPMNPGGSAVGFLLTGIAMLLITHPEIKKSVYASRICAAGVMLIAVCGIGHYLFGWSEGPDNLLFGEALEREAGISGHANRIAPNTAAAFLLISAALTFIDVKIRTVRPAQVLALMVVTLSLLTIVGYAYSTLHLTAVQQHIPMALNTAICFFLASLGILCARPEDGVMAVFSGTGTGGILARRMLPFVVLLPALTGCLIGYLVRAGMIEQLTAISLFSLSCILLMTAFTWRTAISLETMGRQLQESEERYNLAAQGSNDGVWDLDSASGRIYWSDRLREMMGVGPDYVPTFDDFNKRLHPDDREPTARARQEHYLHRTPYDVEYRAMTEAGTYTWFRVRGRGVWDASGKMVRMLGSMTDVSDRKLAELAYRSAREQAEKASQAKSDFLSHMSHELRTPLNSIIGLTRLLHGEKGLDAEHRDMARVAYRSAENLLVIVNDILDLAKVESGQIELESIPFSFAEVANSVVETMAPLCSEKNLNFTSNMAVDEVSYFVGDPTRLSRVMVNLIGNAIKYTEQGSVTLSLSCKPDGKDRVLLEGAVTDTGIGIPADKLDHIFKAFTQADSSITRRFGGTGLGLNITRQIIEKMNGEVGVESELGKGSRFWFRIPFATADIRPEESKRTFQNRNLARLPAHERRKAAETRLLVAEDYVLNQSFMRSLLSRMNISNIDIVDNGRQAVEAFSKHAYDLVLMDCHMPLMSGFDATKEIRLLESAKAAHIPIIAMTADAMAGSRERCIKAGMDDYISKPINGDELRHVISRWVTFPDEEGGEACAGKEESSGVAELRKFITDEAEVRRMVDLFLDQTEAILKIFEANCADGPNTDWTEAAHKLKGGAAMLKEEKLKALCETAQHMNAASAEERRAILADIRDVCDDVRQNLKKALA